MTINFQKYHGTGNDFIIVDNREGLLKGNEHERFKELCHRRFGIGADGVILLQNHPELDFEMVYFNADGQLSSMCGNGGRCIIHFAHSLGLIKEQTQFMAIDGLHDAEVLANQDIRLKMQPVKDIQTLEKAYSLDTGSPHYVRFVKSLRSTNVLEAGRKIRYSDPYKEEGINVNFVQIHDGTLYTATYERGVENITYSCGTGVVACSLAAHHAYPEFSEHKEFPIRTEGGSLKVSFEPQATGYDNIWLEGPAVKVFEGNFEINK